MASGEKGQYEDIVNYFTGRTLVKSGEEPVYDRKDGVFKYNTYVLVLAAFVGLYEDCKIDKENFEGTKGEIHTEFLKITVLQSIYFLFRFFTGNLQAILTLMSLGNLKKPR